MSDIERWEQDRWRCVECGHEQDSWQIGCPKCHGDLIGFKVEVVRADDYQRAVEEIEKTAREHCHCAAETGPCSVCRARGYLLSRP